MDKKINKNEFFREATLRICGDLEIGQAMGTFLSYVKDFIPVDRMVLLYYDKNEGAIRIIADATPEKGESVDQIIPISEEAEAFLIEKYGKEVPEPYYYENPFEAPAAREILNHYKQKAESVLAIPLGIRKMQAGVAIFVSVDSKYNETHLKMASLLKEPFHMAMSNAIKHRNELRLFDRNFFFEVTQRICGNLEIEEGLHACIQYISQFMPADRIYLEKYHADLDSMHIIARADRSSFEKMDKYVPFNKAAKNKMIEISKVYRAGELPSVLVINNPEKEPVTKNMLEVLNEPMSSALSLPLFIKDRVVGTLVLLAEGNDRYEEQHAKLFATLKLPFFVALSNTMKHREVLQLKDMLADDNRYLQRELHRISGNEIIGANFGLKDVMNKANRAASVDSPVLLLGETGVGKDVIANAIHYSSPRRDGPFIKVNCGAIPETLVDSELFGHEKGSFTGAISQKRGKFERANEGTIFLDEIGELQPQVQVRLLRVLQEKEIERVGGTKPIKLDIRVIAATNCDLEEMVKNKKFREDLWFRINVFPIQIPPLRERKADIPALVQHFIKLKAKELKLHTIPTLKEGAIDPIMHYHWPGNIRELQNVVERAMILCSDNNLTFKDVKLLQQERREVSSESSVKSEKLDEMISSHIQTILARTNGKIHGPGGAAELLGINASTLRNRIRKLNINYK